MDEERREPHRETRGEDQHGHGDLTEPPPQEGQEERSEAGEAEESPEAGSVEALPLSNLPDFPPVPGRDDYVPALRRPTPASASSGSQAGQERDHSSSARSSTARSVREQAKARTSIPSKDAETAKDSDSQAPAQAEVDLEIEENREEANFFEPSSSLSVDETIQELVTLIHNAAHDQTRILALAHHRQTDQVYFLVLSGSEFQVYRLTPGSREMDMSFTVSTVDRDSITSMSKNASMAVNGDFLAVSVPVNKSISVYDLHGGKVKETVATFLDDIDDMTSTRRDSVYCLLYQSEVLEYQVPGLERVRKITPPGLMPHYMAIKIASCPDTGNVVILQISSIANDTTLVNMFDGNWEYLMSIFGPIPALSFPCLSLSGEELLIGGRHGAENVLYHINYSTSFAARGPIPGGAGHAVTMCHETEDRVLVAVRDRSGGLGKESDGIYQINIRDSREQAAPVMRRQNIIVLPNNLQQTVSYVDDAENLFWFRTPSSIRTCHGMNKANGEMLEISERGYITAYGRDGTRPLTRYKLKTPDRVTVFRFDTTDRGDVVAVSIEGHLMVFSSNRQLQWSVYLDKTIWDVVCVEDTVYALHGDEVSIHALSTHEGRRRTAESRCLQLEIEDHDPNHTRLAVHGQLLFVMVPRRGRVHKIDLSDPEPTFTTFLQLTTLAPSCLAVTEEGELVLGGHRGNYSSFSVGKCDLHVYSPDGTRRRRVALTQRMYDINMVLCPGGGLFVVDSNVNVPKFIERF